MLKDNKKAAGGHQAAYESTNRLSDDKHFPLKSQGFCQKIKPGYFYELQNHPNADPIFVVFDFFCVNYIRSCGGVCLLCNKDPDCYELSFCYDKESWLLCAKQEDFDVANQLGYKMLNCGAIKILILPFYCGQPRRKCHATKC
jgi:hypothetical protein